MVGARVPPCPRSVRFLPFLTLDFVDMAGRFSTTAGLTGLFLLFQPPRACFGLSYLWPLRDLPLSLREYADGGVTQMARRRFVAS